MEDELKLAKIEVWVYKASGQKYALRRNAIRMLKEIGRIARMVRRKKDKAVVAVYLRAEPNEIGPMNHRTSTVVPVLPMTYTHRESLAKGL